MKKYLPWHHVVAATHGETALNTVYANKSTHTSVIQAGHRSPGKR
jgi:hypothetical protein